MKNMSDSDSRVGCTLKIDSREDIGRVREVIERELPGIEKRLRETGYITTDVWYNGVSSVDETGITLEFIVFCDPFRLSAVQRMLNEEVVDMCQRNGIRLAVSRSLLEDTAGSGETGGTERCTNVKES